MFHALKKFCPPPTKAVTIARDFCERNPNVLVRAGAGVYIASNGVYFAGGYLDPTKAHYMASAIGWTVLMALQAVDKKWLPYVFLGQTATALFARHHRLLQLDGNELVSFGSFAISRALGILAEQAKRQNFNTTLLAWPARHTGGLMFGFTAVSRGFIISAALAQKDPYTLATFGVTVIGDVIMATNAALRPSQNKAVSSSSTNKPVP